MNEDYKARRKEYDAKSAAAKNTGMKFTTVSGEEINVLYGPDDIEEINFLSDIGFPGEYPYTRGIHTNGYRAGFGRCGSSPGSGHPRIPTRDFIIFLITDKPGFPLLSIFLL